MSGSDENERDCQNSTSCYICGEEYSDEDNFIMHKGKKITIKNYPVRDHCHITGRYQGSAHNSCNLQLRLEPESIKIPVICHNLKGYDSHFIMQKVGKLIEEKSVCATTYHQNKCGEIEETKNKINISVIANNFEKYISFRIGNHLQFIDSFQFMSQSLDKLSSNLPKDKFFYTDREVLGSESVKKKLRIIKKERCLSLRLHGFFPEI